MATKFNLYPMLTVDKVKDFVKNVKYYFSYFDPVKNESIDIGYEIISNSFNLNTKDSKWNPYSFDLELNVEIEYCNGCTLYGPNGIAPRGSNLSLALEWYSQKERLRNVVHNSNFIKNDNDDYCFKFHVTFPKNSFVESIQLNILTYLQKQSLSVSEDELFLNNTEGVLLGNVDSKLLYMTGIGSLFPVFTVPLDSKLLWDIQFIYDDPSIDQLSTSLKVTINSAHPDYKYLQQGNKEYCDRVSYEIMSNAMTTMLCDLKGNGCLDDLHGTFEDGSILSLAKYYQDIIEMDFSTYLSISSSIRTYLEGVK